MLREEVAEAEAVVVERPTLVEEEEEEVVVAVAVRPTSMVEEVME